MDLTTNYMGLSLKHPIIASASPLSYTLDNIKRLQDANAAAIVMFSLFEEQIRHETAAMDYFLDHSTESFAESLSYFPAMDEYQLGPYEYLELIRKAVDSVDIPIIGSLNGITNEGWIDYAIKIEQAGAKGLELNIFYIPADFSHTSEEVEALHIEILKAVKQNITIPVALKLSPFFSAMGNMAQRFDQAGADALVLFNRFYQPDFDIDRLEVSPTLQLSTPQEIRLPLLWISMLYGRINASLGASTGVHNSTEVIKYLLAGADTVMSASGLLKYGPEVINSYLNELKQWLEKRDYASLYEMRGVMSQKNVANPDAFERANYIKILESYRTNR